MSMKHKNFAVFILTHGRADNIITLKTLNRLRYTGDIYYIVDNMDKQLDKYIENFGDNVLVFDKIEAMRNFDTMDNFGVMKSIVYARNQVQIEAEALGLDYALQLDDDYSSFMFRYPSKDGKKLLHSECKDLDKAFDIMIDFLIESDADTVAFAQGGDFIGGIDGMWDDGIKRKAMNSFFTRMDRPFKFVGNINEDVNTYVSLGHKGKLFMTVTNMMLNQKQTQQNAGGMSGLYLESGTYLKSFYTVMIHPSGVKIGMMGDKHKRLHHSINWNNTTPKIINEKYRKE